jgi:hypothetical protein
MMGDPKKLLRLASIIVYCHPGALLLPCYCPRSWHFEYTTDTTWAISTHRTLSGQADGYRNACDLSATVWT